MEQREQRKLGREQKRLQIIHTKRSKIKIIEDSKTSEDEEPEGIYVDPLEISQGFCDLE